MAGGAVAVGLGAAVNKAADFEHSISSVGALANATAPQLKQLSAAAIQLGADTRLTGIGATDASRAMESLAAAGFSVDEMTHGVTEGVLLLASATGSSVTQAATIAGDAFGEFRKSMALTAADMPMIANLFTGAANVSSISLEDIGNSMKDVGPVAAAMGISIQNVTAAIAELGNQGIKGGQAGTALRGILASLADPSKESAKLIRDLGLNFRDAQGNMKDFGGIAEELKTKLGGLTAAEREHAVTQIFGRENMAAVLALMSEGSQGIADYTQKIKEQGDAAAIGAARNNNLKGSLENLGSVFETAVIQVGSKFTPIVRTATEGVTDLLTQVMKSPEAQKALDDLASKGAAGLQQLFTKVKDPAFQQSMKEWGTAALDVGKAIASLAGDIASKLGPPLKAAADWFNSLDEGGKRNVITFALVAGAAVKFRDELSTLLTVGNSVVKMFGEKAAAKALLTKANEGLAGSAANTAAKMTLVRAAAATAGVEIAGAAVITVAAAASWGGLILAADKYNDVTGTTARNERELTGVRAAQAIAFANGATETNNVIDGYMRLILEQGALESGTGRLSAIWNEYVASLQGSAQSTDSLGLSLVGMAQFISGQVIPVLGEGLIAGQAFNTTITGLGSAAKELAGSMAVVAPAVSAADQALGAVVLSADQVGIGMGTAAASFGAVVNAAGPMTDYSVAASAALSDLNTFGTAAAQGLNAAASAAMGAAMALSDADKVIQGLGQTAGTLQGYLRPLQQQWDELNIATENGKHVTAEQAAAYAELAPFIQYLNAQIGANKDQNIAATEAAVKAYQAAHQTGTAYTAAAAAAGVSAGATRAAGAAAQTSAGLFGGLTTSVQGVPKTATVDTSATQAAAIAGTIQMAKLTLAVRSVPTAINIVANVNIGPALSAIETLRNNMPHSPAKEGPFRQLPDWSTVFDTFEPAIQNAVALVEKFGAAFQGVELDLAKKASETASSVAGAVKGAVDALKALSGLNLAKDMPTGAQTTGLIGFVSSLTAQIADAARAFSEEGLKAAGSFADTASKVVGLVGNAVTAFTSLGKYTPIATGAIYAFGKTLRALMNDFALIAEQVTQEAADAASAFATGAGAVVDVVGKGADAFTKLGTYVAIPVAAIYAFGKTLRAVVNDFALLAEQVTQEATDAAAKFASGAGTVVDTVGKGVAAFLALATYADPPAAAIYAFGKTLRAVINDLALVAEQVTQDAADAAAKFAASAGSVVGVFGNAISGFTSLLTFVAPSQAAIDNFAFAVREMVAKFADLAGTISADGMKGAAELGGAAGTIFAALKNALDVFTGLAKLVVPSAKAIDDFGIAVAYTVSRIGSLADQIGKDGIERAAKFGASVQTIFGSLKSSMDILTNLAKFKDVAATAFTSLQQGLVAAVETAQGMVDQSKELVLMAQEFAANMAKASALFGSGLGGGSPEGVGKRLGEGIASGARTALDSHSPSQVMAAIGRDVVAGLVQGMTAAQQDAAKTAADVASAVAKAITDTLGAATALGKLDVATLPGAAQIGGILAFTRALVAEMAASSTLLNEDGVKTTSAFADAASKVAGAVSASVGALTALTGYAQVGRIAIDNFGSDLRIAINDLIYLSGEIATDLATQAASWSEQVVKAVALYGVGVDALTKMKGYAQVGSASIYAFGKDLMLAVADLGAMADLLGQELADKAGAFGEQVGKATGGIAGAVAGLAALRDYVRVPAAALYGFGKDLLALLGDFAAIIDLVGVEMVQKAGSLGESLGKAFGSISAVVQGFKDLANFQSVSDAVMDAFSTGVQAMIARLGQIAATLSTQGVDAAARLGEGFSKVFGGLSSATGFFKSLDNLLLPDQAGIDRILSPILLTVGALADAARRFDPATLAAAGGLADLIGKVSSALTAGNRAMVPATAGGGGGGGGTTYIYNFNMYGSVTGFDAFEDQVVSALEDARRRGRIT